MPLSSAPAAHVADVCAIVAGSGERAKQLEVHALVGAKGQHGVDGQFVCLRMRNE